VPAGSAQPALAPLTPPPSPRPHVVAERPRIAALDAARALGVVAMVVGHTLDAVLAASVRGHPALVTYWKARGFTAPLFMMAAGWALAVAIGRSEVSGLAIARRRLPRALLLLALGYGLRWPGWATDQLSARAPAVWAHFLAFDALHVIGVSVLATALLLGLPWTVRTKVIALALAGLLAIAIGTRAPPFPLLVDPASLPPSIAGMALAQAAGGTSPFPLAPWAAFFFAGAIVGLLVGEGGRRNAQAMALVGGALVLATAWKGMDMLPVGSPILVTFRIGVVLLLFAALYAVPAAVAARLAPLGRTSLAVYAIHVPIVYGWSTQRGLMQRIGPVLPLASAVALAVAVLAGSLAIRAAARWGWRRRGVAGATIGSAFRTFGGEG
jgi:uncharacterized membrane protein